MKLSITFFFHESNGLKTQNSLKQYGFLQYYIHKSTKIITNRNCCLVTFLTISIKRSISMALLTHSKRNAIYRNTYIQMPQMRLFYSGKKKNIASLFSKNIKRTSAKLKNTQCCIVGILEIQNILAIPEIQDIP